MLNEHLLALDAIAALYATGTGRERRDLRTLTKLAYGRDFHRMWVGRYWRSRIMVTVHKICRRAG